MQTHRLKTWPVYFKEVKSGEKTFEFRKNDRDFKTGDTVILEEWCPLAKQYSGEFLYFTIGYILPHHSEVYDCTIKNDYVTFSLLGVMNV